MNLDKSFDFSGPKCPHLHNNPADAQGFFFKDLEVLPFDKTEGKCKAL